MTDDYVEGDINTIEGGVSDDGFEDDYEDGADSGSADDSDADRNEDVAGSELPEEVLTYLARSLASDPDAVVVEAEDRRGQIRLSLHVGPGDMGRVIGRRGRTAQAMRALVAVAGARTGVSTSVDIVDD
jgi:predicted RNA-binding protein YlqC (UPF0109 family)